MTKSIEEVEAEYNKVVIAVVYDAKGDVFDYCFNWESGQSYALNGYKVTAIKPDSIYTVNDLQRLFNVETARHDDCFKENN
jgi:nitrogenase subunit NifH